MRWELRVRAGVLALLVAGTVLASCTGDDDGEPAATVTPSPPPGATATPPAATPTAPAATPTPPPADPEFEGSVAYECGGALCLIDLGGGTSGEALIDEPVQLAAWSPDGQHVAYYGDEGEARALIVYTVSTGVRRVLTELIGVHDPVPPAWSPDGTRIAIEDTVDGDFDGPGSPTEILVIDVATGTITRPLARDNELDTDQGPRWSPDGQRLVFASNRGGGSDIFVVNIDGAELVNLTSGEETNITPTWLPDGRVAFFSDRAGNWDLFVAEADGTGVTNVTDDPGWDGTGAVGHRAPDVSPDGRFVAILSDREGGPYAYVVEVATGSATRVSGAEASWAPTWSPDGRFLLVPVAGAGGQLLVVTADGQDEWPLSDRSSYGVWRPASSP